MVLRVPHFRAVVAIAVSAAFSTGCVSFQPSTSAAARLTAQGSDGGFGFAVAKHQTRFEASARTTSDQRDQDNATRDRKGTSPALFWTGVILGSIGVITLGTGVGLGVATESQIREGDADGQTRANREALEQRGAVSNDVAIAGGVLTVIGLGLAAAVAGIDYSRCGPVIGKKRRRACESLDAGIKDDD